MCVCVCGSTNVDAEGTTDISVHPPVCLTVFHSEVYLSDRHTSWPTSPVSLSSCFPLLVDGAREDLHYISLPILCMPPTPLPALQYVHRMAPPTESAANPTICLQWRGRGGRREGGMLEGEGQKERQRSVKGEGKCVCVWGGQLGGKGGARW